MATDYDAPRKTDDDTESLDAINERVSETRVTDVDLEDIDGLFYELPAETLSDIDDVAIVPPQVDEFTCVSCFLVKHRSLIDHEDKIGPICVDCA